MKSYTEIIEKYLNNELSATERKSFEEELKMNKELKKQFEVQKEIMKGIQQQGLRTDINKAVKKVKLNKLIKTAVVLTLTVAVAVLGTYYMTKNVFSKPNNHVQYELNEQGNTNWSEADKNLESQVFKIDPSKDTIIETEKGIIFQIKAGTFLNKFGESQKEPFDLEVKEAMTGYDIIKAGLSTTSNGELLETGGMFYINARNGNEVLKIAEDKAIKVHVPSSGDKKMSLFDGERMKNGNINWVSPKPMIKQLSTVDILSLNFYPPNFIDTLKRMGFNVKNKILTDSIYYSFHCLENEGHLMNMEPKPVYESESDQVKPSAAEIAKIERENRRVGDSLAKAIAASMATGVYSPADTLAFNYQRSSCEIDPSRIHAIRDRKFNRTILATKAFEERMQTIFTMCNAEVFKLYTENLNRPLYEIDSMAAGKLSGGEKEKFLEFYRRQDGGVDISDEQNAQFQNYMNEKKKIYDKAVSDAMAKLYGDEDKKAGEAEIKRGEHNEESINRTNTILIEEIELNMDEAYRQLGKTRSKVVITSGTSGIYLSGFITTPGFKNVDQYVVESTVSRTTLDYTDPATGKKAVIEYKKAAVMVKNYKDFDRIVSYLLPNKLSSFQLMKDSTNGFFEKLNMTLEYSIITVGYIGENTFYNDIQYAKPQNYDVTLKKIDAAVLMGRLNSRYNFAGTRDVLKDIEFGSFEQKETARTNVIKKREEIRDRLYSVVFPCVQQH